MSAPARPRVLLGLLTATLVGAGGLLMLADDGPVAGSVMSADQRAYWNWVSTIGEDSDVDEGIVLLGSIPDFRDLYIRLAEICRRRGREYDCRLSLESAKPASRRSALYRDAALAELSADPAAWMAVSRSRELDATLARRIVDRLQGDDQLLRGLESRWRSHFKQDSSLAGVSFGLGYLATRRHSWEDAGKFLQRSLVLAPDEIDVYRELGRMYFFTGDQEGFVRVLETGIAIAESVHDLEQEAILRGNLGLGYLQWTGDLEKAAWMFESSLARARELNLGRSIAIGSYRLADVRARQYRYRDALALIDSSDVWYDRYAPERKSELLVLRSRVLTSLYRYSEAERSLAHARDSARRHGDRLHEAQTLLALADLRLRLGRPTESYEAADSARSIAASHQAADYVIGALATMGKAERQTGDYRAADLQFDRGLTIARRTKNTARMIELSRELGISALLSEDLSAAQAYFDFVVGTAEDSGTPAASALYWIGNMYHFFGLWEHAAGRFAEALSKLSREDGHLRGLIQRNLAASELELGRSTSALARLEDAHVLLDGDHVQSAGVAITTGRAYLDRREFGRALEHFRRAQQLEGWLPERYEIYHGLGLAFWGSGESNAAERSFREAIEEIEQRRDQVLTAGKRYAFAFSRADVYQSYAHFLEEHGRPADAINISERARSRSLVDLMYTTQMARGNSEGDLSIRAIDAVTRSRLLSDELSGDLSGVSDAPSGSDGIRVDALLDENAALQALVSQLEHDLRQTHPLYTFSPVGYEEIQSILGRDEAVLIYNNRSEFNATPSHISAHVIRADSIVVVRLELDENRAGELVRRLREQVSQIESDEWASTATTLHDLLISPILPYLGTKTTQLNIVAQGALHFLPFAILLGRSSREHLVERFAISNTPSLSVLKFTRERNPGSWERVLLLGDPQDDLPGARREVNLIASLYPGASRVALGKGATSGLLEEAAAHYQIVHIATHGTFYPRQPAASHLNLSDKRLTAADVGRLRLRAYLVTLSGCDTGMSTGLGSDAPPGDEWIGLHQAFLAAGTPTVVASLWSIHDRYSGPLLSRFYAELGPEGKAVALARAQRSFIRDDVLRHPYFWSGLVVIGDPR